MKIGMLDTTNLIKRQNSPINYFTLHNNCTYDLTLFEDWRSLHS